MAGHRARWADGRGGAGGENLAPGATVFFNLPADYDGSTPVTLSFTDASGATIRTFNLHRRTAAARGENQAGGRGGRGGGATPAQQEERLTAMEPGMNRFQWDLRYPDAAEVKGIFHSGFSASQPTGPEVVPGTYYVTLTYGGTAHKQPLVVKLDPRLQTTQVALRERFDCSCEFMTP